MWIVTLDGFFSVCNNKYCRPDEILVQSRGREDLESLAEKANIGPILEAPPGHRYPFYAIMKRTNWAGYLSGVALEFDYVSLQEFEGSIWSASNDWPDERYQTLRAVWAAIKNVYEGKSVT